MTRNNSQEGWVQMVSPPQQNLIIDLEYKKVFAGESKKHIGYIFETVAKNRNLQTKEETELVRQLIHSSLGDAEPLNFEKHKELSESAHKTQERSFLDRIQWKGGALQNMASHSF